MIRKFLLPALALAMLGGCVTSGYEYRGGNGDYYYGQPQVEYRDYGYPYGGVGYGYPGGWSGSFGWGYGYGYYGGYYDPWRYYTPYRRPYHHDHHDDDASAGDHRPPPWRDFVRVRPPGVIPLPQQPQQDDAMSQRRPMPRMRDPQIVRREPVRAQDRRESDRLQIIRSEPDRDPRRKHEP